MTAIKPSHSYYRKPRKSLSLTTKDPNADVVERLIEEIAKPKMHFSSNTKQQRLSKRLSSIFLSTPSNSRNLSAIVAMLKQYVAFNQFLLVNDIDDNSLERMANYLEVKCFQKNQFLYIEGDKPDCFYILLKGRLSIKKWVKQRSKDKSPCFVEEEMIITEPGYAFNERNFLLKERRTSSCTAIDDCVLLSLDAEAFKQTIIKALIKNENVKKSFLLTSLINIPGLNHQLYEGLYNSVSPRLIRSNEFLIKENEVANRIFIVFQNELIVTKYIVTKDKSINHPLCKVSKGVIFGLEVLFGKDCYSYSFQGCHQQEESTYVFELNVNQISEDMRRKLANIHAKFYLKFKEAMEGFYKSKLKREKSNCLSYPNISLDLFSNEELFNHALEKNYYQIVEEQRSKERSAKLKVIPSKIAIYSKPKLTHKKLFASPSKRSSNIFAEFNSFAWKHSLIQSNQRTPLNITLNRSCKGLRIKTMMTTNETRTKLKTNTHKAGHLLLNKSNSMRMTLNDNASLEHSLGQSFSTSKLQGIQRLKDPLSDYVKATSNFNFNFNSGMFKIPLVAERLIN